MEGGRDELSERLFEGGEDTQELVNQGASVKYLDKNGWTALHYAVVRDEEELVRQLIRAGADHAGIRRLMHRTADRRHCVWIAIVRKREASGGDVGALDRQVLFHVYCVVGIESDRVETLQEIINRPVEHKYHDI